MGSFMGLFLGFGSIFEFKANGLEFWGRGV